MSASALQAIIRLKLEYARTPNEENLRKQVALADQLTHEEAVYVVRQYESEEYYQKQARNGPGLVQAKR